MNERIEIPINVSLSETGTEVSFNDDGPFNASFGTVEKVSTSNYDELFNKPKINSVEVQGDKNGADYNLQDKMAYLTPQEIERILYLD